ncbi:MAG: DUF4248 domain-containing protein [Parabacteroides sp.]|nr:DUF4248 domain-containing protein [Parabacteroides sp.]
MDKQTDQSDEHVKVRSYGLTELGLLYNPALQPDSAAKALKRWIAFNTDLTAALQEAGWRKGQRKFTPLQTQQVFRFLGEP